MKIKMDVFKRFGNLNRIVQIDMVSQKGLPSKPSPAGMDNDGYRMIPMDSSSGRTREKISQ